LNESSSNIAFFEWPGQFYKMNDASLEQRLDTVRFYPGKKQLMPIVFNIAVAPVLLYLTRLWPWPPTILHLGVFMLTTIMAMRYLRHHLKKARMQIDDSGIHCGKSYPADKILGVKPYMRALKVWLDVDGKEKEEVINLWWAGRDDLQSIVQLTTERYGLRE